MEMRFKIIPLLMLALLGQLFLGLWAQPAASARQDTALVAGFSGIISYRITYPDIKDAALLAMLPDSQVVTFSDPWVMSQSYGGQATEMGIWTLWNLDSGKYWMVSEEERRVYTLPADDSPAMVKLVQNRTAKPKTILSHPCRQFDHTHDKLVDSWWSNDSLFITRPAVDSLVNAVPPFFAQGSRAIPLRMIRRSEAGTTLVEAVGIMEGGALVRSLPKDYEWMIFNPLLPRHPLTGLGQKQGN